MERKAQSHSWRPISPPLTVVWQTSLAFVANRNVSHKCIDMLTFGTSGVNDGCQESHGSQSRWVRGRSPPSQPEWSRHGEISSLSCSDPQPFTKIFALLASVAPSGHLNYPLMFSSVPHIHSESRFLSSDTLLGTGVYGSEEVWSKRSAEDEKRWLH